MEESVGCLCEEVAMGLSSRQTLLLLPPAVGGRRSLGGWWATSAAPEADSDLAGGIPGEGVAQRRLVEAPPVGAEVIVVLHVVQHFTGQLLLP